MDDQAAWVRCIRHVARVLNYYRYLQLREWIRFNADRKGREMKEYVNEEVDGSEEYSSDREGSEDSSEEDSSEDDGIDEDDDEEYSEDEDGGKN